MAVSDGNRPSRSRSVLATVLAVLILVPAGILFVSDWRHDADDRDATALEQKGVDYLAGLMPLISALTEAQSAALAGKTEPPASLTAAMAQMGTIDQRDGGDLTTTPRWTTLRDSIGRLPAAGSQKPAVLQAYVEATTLAVALADVVADNSGLSVDRDSDVWHLRKALAVDLPSTVVAATRAGDLSGLYAAAKADVKQQAALMPQFGASLTLTGAGVTNLTDNLHSAVDASASPTLSGSLVSTLDGFRRSIDLFNRDVNPTGVLAGGAAPDAAKLTAAQGQVRNAQAGLVDVLTRELHGLLDTRSDSLSTDRILMLALAALLVLLLVAVVLLGRGGRSARPASGPARGTPSESPDRFGRRPDEPAPAYAEVGRTRQERSSALR